MTSPIVSSLFPNGEPLAFSCELNGKVFCKQWTTFQGEAAGIHSFDLILEVDPSVLGGGGSMVRGRSRLDTDEALQPLRYMSESGGRVVQVYFEADSVAVVLPNNARQSFPRAGAEWIMETYMIGLDAMFYAIAAAQQRLSEKLVLKHFFLNQLMVAPYTVTPAPELGPHHYRSSYDEEVELDEHGLMRRVRNPKYGIDTIQLRPPPALPEWRNQISGTALKPAVYQRPANAPFTSQDLAIQGGEVPIGATLTVPPGAGPHPAVLFLSGSGALDRNGMSGEVDVGSHEIVDHLSSSGFVGLRFDKRGAGLTPRGPDPDKATRLDTIINDAEVALKFLQGRPEIDPKRIFLIGHSEGATVALALATLRNAEVAGLVLLASRGRGMDEISLAQVEATARHKGHSEAQIQAQLDETRQFFELVKSGREWKSEDMPDALYVGARSVPWLRDHFGYPVEQLITKVKCPVAIFHGEADFQVPVAQGAELAERARSAGVPVSFQSEPKLDHLFKPVAGESSLSSYYTERHVDQHFLDQLTAWLQQHR